MTNRVTTINDNSNSEVKKLRVLRKEDFMSCTVTKEVKEVEVTGTVDVSDIVGSSITLSNGFPLWDIRYSVNATICGNKVEWEAHIDDEVESMLVSQKWYDEVVDMIYDDFIYQVD